MVCLLRVIMLKFGLKFCVVIWLFLLLFLFIEILVICWSDLVRLVFGNLLMFFVEMVFIMLVEFCLIFMDFCILFCMFDICIIFMFLGDFCVLMGNNNFVFNIKDRFLVIFDLFKCVCVIVFFFLLYWVICVYLRKGFFV